MCKPILAVDASTNILLGYLVNLLLGCIIKFTCRSVKLCSTAALFHAASNLINSCGVLNFHVCTGKCGKVSGKNRTAKYILIYINVDGNSFPLTIVVLTELY